jgi:hypothetical protein
VIGVPDDVSERFIDRANYSAAFRVGESQPFSESGQCAAYHAEHCGITPQLHSQQQIALTHQSLLPQAQEPEFTESSGAQLKLQEAGVESPGPSSASELVELVIGTTVKWAERTRLPSKSRLQEPHIVSHLAGGYRFQKKKARRFQRKEPGAFWRGSQDSVRGLLLLEDRGCEHRCAAASVGFR